MNNFQTKNRRIKVVWICHFSNSTVRALIPLSKRNLINTFNKIFRKHATTYSYYDFAPWVSNLIKEFTNIHEIELHIISPMKGLKMLDFNITYQGIHYHFFKPDLPLLHIDISNVLPKILKYRFNRFYIRRKINSIKPDIVNLIGAENPYYSISALDVKNFPLFVSCQTIYSNPARESAGDRINLFRQEVEIKIINQFKYFGCSGRLHRDLLLNFNPSAIVFKMFFPFEYPNPNIDKPQTKYDFVFFAGLAKKKGVEDLIHALKIVKSSKSDVSLNIIGKASPSYIGFLKNEIQLNGLTENIVFTDYFKSIQDLHEGLLYSKFTVLPLKLDIISSAIKEAMVLGLPVVTYKTSGTPYLNRDGQAVLIAEMNNIEQLAQHMISLLESPELADKLRKNARVFVDKEFNNTVSAQRLVKTYHAVINHYHHNEPIPEELLFNPEEFPLY